MELAAAVCKLDGLDEINSEIPQINGKQWSCWPTYGRLQAVSAFARPKSLHSACSQAHSLRHQRCCASQCTPMHAVELQYARRRNMQLTYVIDCIVCLAIARTQRAQLGASLPCACCSPTACIGAAKYYPLLISSCFVIRLRP